MTSLFRKNKPAPSSSTPVPSTTESDLPTLASGLASALRLASAVPKASQHLPPKFAVLDSQRNEEHTINEKRLKLALDSVAQILEVATAATAAFPPAQSVIGGVSKVINLANVITQLSCPY